jgi:hypothetical protein
MELSAAFRRLSVPDSAYSIGHDSNEAYCLIEERDGWHVYYSERGHRNAEQIFASESSAAAELMRRLLADGAVAGSIDARHTA